MKQGTELWVEEKQAENISVNNTIVRVIIMKPIILYNEYLLFF